MQQPVITRSAAESLTLGKNGSYSNEGNVLQHTLWDMLPFQNTTLAATNTFFVAPISATKTIIETNLQDAGKLPNGQTFLIKEIGLALIAGVVGADTDVNTVLAAYFNIIQNSVFEIKIAGREYDYQAPGANFLNSVQVAGLNSAINGADTVGYFLATGWQKLSATPIVVGQLVTFSVIQRSGSNIAAVATILDTASDVLNTQNARLEVRLRGILTRAI